jgi:hypothetical protein
MMGNLQEMLPSLASIFSLKSQTPFGMKFVANYPSTFTECLVLVPVFFLCLFLLIVEKYIKTYRAYVFFRWIDLVLLGLLGGLISAAIFPFDGSWMDDRFDCIYNHLNGLLLLMVVMGSLLVFGLQLKGWFPYNKTFLSWSKWPPLYLPVFIGLVILVLIDKETLEYRSTLIPLISGTCLLSIIIPSLYRSLYNASGPPPYKHEDAPITSLEEDKLKRLPTVKRLASYWHDDVAPKSGAIIGAYGAGKTSLVNITDDYCKKHFGKSIIVSKISFWGFAERDIVAYTINESVRTLSEYFDSSAFSGLGKEYSKELLGADNLLDRIKYIFPSPKNLKALDRVLGILDKRLIIVFEDIDREYRFSKAMDDWDVSERHQLHQIEQFADQVLFLRNIGIWFTLNPNALNVIGDAFGRCAPGIISLEDAEESKSVELMIRNWIEKGELV